MLNNVPSGINRMRRNVVINHPNTWECQVFKKTVNRNGEPVVGGLPTLGGAMVLSSEDEESVSWEHVGSGYALEAETFSPASMTDRQDANIGPNVVRYLIEPEFPEGMEGHFFIRKHFVIYMVITDEVRVAYEVVDIETVMNVSPYATRFVMNRRSDLDLFD
ncbi:hypothetical protein [Nitrosomonas marina]|uniref:Uncharacterized protein n=1 Tax=Nitrosomonas marina TaxID=917 RepID=A0A1H8IN31_9PROT|nr:hypothetical protein [Nitrosomonas marina]SEN69789.1 hypothetical protein SAMN05216325_1369 [Nitrosomonas marina]